MSWWGDFTKPLNRAFNSDTFKAVFPVQAIANKAGQWGSGLMGVNNGRGLSPADQYAIGGGVGSVLGGGSALLGMGKGAGAAGAGAGQTGNLTATDMLRMMNSQGAPAQEAPMQQPPDIMAQIYKLYPMLRPNMGGFRGSR